ncbi:MAG: type II toxin-antitoxin system VapC family toxin [Spirochaetaceae bacterium]|nr:MAG: type II toxin-antitoxin system VapC family toxin [Spirochaetaceae bacterium]
MRFLVDTHALLWWWAHAEKLSGRVRALIRDPSNTILVSAASSWEIATKYRIGKLPSGARIVQTWDSRMQTSAFTELPVTSAHASKSGILPGDHRDPFDRMIAAQSLIEHISVLSIDSAISELGADRIWD